METIKLKEGEVLLRSPLGGAIQDALINSSDKNGFNEAKVLIELIPNCVHSHPWGTTPIRTALRQMDGMEYIKLLNGAKTLLEPLMGTEQVKKSEELSEQESVTTDGSQTK